MKFILPLRVHKSKNKLFSLNLNAWRNAHYQVLNKTKKEFKEIFKRKYGYAARMFKAPVRITYTIFFANKRNTDLGNVGAIIGKYAEDCLVELQYLEDDSRKIVKEIRYKDGGVDREDPRCEMVVEEIEKGDLKVYNRLVRW